MWMGSKHINYDHEVTAPKYVHRYMYMYTGTHIQGVSQSRKTVYKLTTSS